MPDNVVMGTSGRRMALVLGNKAYLHTSTLKNSVNDANDVTEALRKLGFDVGKTLIDADYRQTMAAINEFVAKLLPGDVVVFYYSGHGIGYAGKNYLLPIDADITCVERIDEHGIPLGRIMNWFEQKQVRTSFLFLDACRNVPNLKACQSSTRDITTQQGLVRPTNNPRGSMIVFATEEGTTADDNLSGRNGLFTGELLKYLTRPNWGIRMILDSTTEAVEIRSRYLQAPARYDKLWGDFVFVKTVDGGATPQQTQTPMPAPIAPRIASTNFMSVKGGAFKMGTDNRSYNEKPAHEVNVGGFQVSRYEVMVDEWQTFCRDMQRPMPIIPDTDLPQPDSYWRGRERHPITNITWLEAIEYANWLSQRQGLRKAYQIEEGNVTWDQTANGFRLPTEAEWELAARGNDVDLPFAGGRFETEVGWVKENSNESTHTVGTKKANNNGLHDLTGNVWEWCWDWYDEYYYARSSKNSPVGAPVGSMRSIRGGSWLTGNNTVTTRRGRSPHTQSTEIGFRLVRNEL